DGASNASMPVGLLLGIALSGSYGVQGAVIVGIMASIRFPLLVPYWSAGAARGLRGFLSAAISAITFGVCMLAALALWGTSYLQIGVLGQLSRESFSLNEFGFLFPNHWVSPSPWLTGLQLGAIALTLVYLWVRPRPMLISACIGLVVLALVTQYLSFNFLLWLMPVALVGHGARRWLYAVGLAGALNYSILTGGLHSPIAILLPAELLSAVMVILLVGLLLSLVRLPETSTPAGSRAAVPDQRESIGSNEQGRPVPSSPLGTTEDGTTGSGVSI
ncbi:MAG: hypothetical protein WCA77_01285, partial [Thermoplasmata archaeon]